MALYSIIQYIPDFVRGEIVNIGVVAYDVDRFKVRFVENWERPSRFGGANADALRDAALQIEKLTLEDLERAVHGFSWQDSIQFKRAVHGFSWQDSIQFTSPRASLLEVDELVADMAKRCLVES